MNIIPCVWENPCEKFQVDFYDKHDGILGEQISATLTEGGDSCIVSVIHGSYRKLINFDMNTCALIRSGFVDENSANFDDITTWNENSLYYMLGATGCGPVERNLFSPEYIFCQENLQKNTFSRIQECVIWCQISF